MRLTKPLMHAMQRALEAFPREVGRFPSCDVLPQRSVQRRVRSNAELATHLGKPLVFGRQEAGRALPRQMEQHSIGEV